MGEPLPRESYVGCSKQPRGQHYPRWRVDQSSQLAELLASADDYGWFTSADLKRVLEAIHQVPQWGDVILVGGQSLSAWIKFFDIPIPPFDGPYLTADADFLGTKIEAQIIADYLKGRSRPATMDDQTINAALIEFTGGRR